MLCALSGEAPQEPVASKLSGAVFEKRLIEKYIEENGKDPVSGDSLTLDDLIPIKSSRVVHPRPPTLTSIPALLSTFQNEWDSLALETYNLREQLLRTREELATALYQHDAAVRVVARLAKERDEARDALSKVTVSADGPSNGDAMAVDAEGLPEELVAKVDETKKMLSRERKKRPVPPAHWARDMDVASYEIRATNALPVPQATTLSLQGDFAVVGGHKGDVAVYSVTSNKVERTFKIDEPITDSIWDGSKIFFSTLKGSVKVFENGTETTQFREHSGSAIALAMHPSKAILASIGSDKSFVFYDLVKMQRASRSYTDVDLTTCAFHPDGHLFAAGTSSGDIKLFMTTTGEEAASFSLGVRVLALAFSENGFWFAAVGHCQEEITIFDLRKEGAKAKAKVIQIGSVVSVLDWDWSQEFLVTAGSKDTSIQHYEKSTKTWTEPQRTEVPAVAVAWGEYAGKLLILSGDGTLSILRAPPIESN